MNYFNRHLRLISTIFGIILLAYFIGVAIYLKRLDAFTLGMLIIGMVWITVSIKIDKVIAAFKRMPKVVRIVVKAVLIIFLASVILVEGLVIYNMKPSAPGGADYVIILGCQVEGDKPSRALADRVNAAIDYLKQNEHTDVVVAGGQGPGENVSEAEAMKEMLVRNGIDEKRIFLEDNSTTTLENFRFANELYDLSDKKVVAVSSDYHLFRAMALAGKLGYSDISGLPSSSEWFPMLAYLMREYVGVTGYALTGRI